MTSLLTALGELTRPNVLELSRRLGIARNTVQARIDRLQQSAVITGWGPVVDLKAMGYEVLAFMTLEIAQGQESPALAELAAIPEVLEIHKTTGPGRPHLPCRRPHQRAPPPRYREGARRSRRPAHDVEPGAQLPEAAACTPTPPPSTALP